MTTPARGLPRGNGTGPSAVPAFSGPISDTRVPEFQRVANGLHPGHVHEFITRMLGELSHLRAQLEQAAASPAGQRLIEDLLADAAREIAGQRAQAAEESARRIEDADRQGQGAIAAARVQADQIMRGATEQAASVIDGARQEAKGMLDAASAKSTAVDQAAGARLDALTARHEDLLSRMRAGKEHLDAILEAEEQRGDLAGEVARVLPAEREQDGGEDPQLQQRARQLRKRPRGRSCQAASLPFVCHSLWPGPIFHRP